MRGVHLANNPSAPIRSLAMKARTVLLLALPLLCGACATAGAEARPGSGSASAAERPRASSRAITREEILDSRLSDVYALVRRLRPNWLRRRGPDVPAAAQDLVVYVDTSRRGFTDAMRGMSASSVFEIRYVDPIAAKTRYGPGHEQGVIVVVTGRP